MTALAIAIAIVAALAWDVARRHLAMRKLDDRTALSARVDALEEALRSEIADVRNRVVALANRAQPSQRLTGLKRS